MPGLCTASPVAKATANTTATASLTVSVSGPSAPAVPSCSSPRSPTAMMAVSPTVFGDWDAIEKHSEADFKKKYGEIAVLAQLLRHRDDGKDRLSEQQKAERAWAQTILHEEVPADYTGPRLVWPLTADCVIGLVEHFKHHPDVILHRRYVVELLVAARDMLSCRPSLLSVVDIKSGNHQRLVIVGDLHGQLADLLTIFHLNGYPDPSDTQYLFNGDFVDRGPHGVEIALALLAFMLLYPSTVRLNRGNHEDPAMQERFGFYEEVQKKYPGGHLFALFGSVFKHLPVCAIVEDTIFVAHGGIPRNPCVHIRVIGPKLPTLDSITEEMIREEEVVVQDLLWADPNPDPGLHGSPRGEDQVTFGPDVTKIFLDFNKLRIVVRSHEVPSDNRGYIWQHDNRVVTVFSASNYCGVSGNYGSVMILSSVTACSFQEYMAPPLHHVLEWEKEGSPPIAHTRVRSEAAKSAQRDVVQQVLELIAERRQDIYWFLKSLDVDKDGTVTLREWQTCMMTVLGINLPWEKYHKQLVKIRENGRIHYGDFLAQFKFACDPKFGGWQKEIKRSLHDALLNANLTLTELKAMLDVNNDGNIDEEELMAAFKHLNLGLTDRQAEELLRGVGQGRGKKGVDMMAFLESLQVPSTFDPEIEEALEFLGSVFGYEYSSLASAFTACDDNHDGRLQYSEFMNAVTRLMRQSRSRVVLESPRLKAKLQSQETLMKIVRAIDSNNSGAIDYMEFIDAMKRSAVCGEHIDNVIQHICTTIHTYRPSLTHAFVLMDINGDGVLSREEFSDGLRALNSVLSPSTQLSQAQIDAVIKHVDLDGNGQIEWQEFLNAFHLNVPDPLAGSPTSSPAGSPSSSPAPSPKSMSVTRPSGGYSATTGSPFIAGGGSPPGSPPAPPSSSMSMSMAARTSPPPTMPTIPPPKPKPKSPGY